MTDKIDTTKIKNFPSNNPNARLTKKGKHLYVTESYVRAFNENGAKLCSYKIIGKVVDNRYYSMEEYLQKFKRNGEPRIPEPKTPNRSYVRTKPFSEVKRKAPKYAEGLPAPAMVKNFPHDVEGARIVRVQKIYYVVTTRYFRENGSGRHQYTYLGRVVDGEFFTMEQYRKLFKRNGERRQEEE